MLQGAIMLRTSIKSFAVAAAALLAVSAQSAEVLTNGGFEAGLGGWTSYTTANGTIAETPSTPTETNPQNASIVLFDVTGTGTSNALFLNAGKINGFYGIAPAEGGGVFQGFTTAGGVATFSADIAGLYTRTSGFFGLGVMSVLIDGVEKASFDLGGGAFGPVTIRNALAFTTRLSAGDHVVSLQATRLFAPARGVASQYFDNVTLDVAAVPEPATWAMMITGFSMCGTALRRRTRAVA